MSVLLSGCGLYLCVCVRACVWRVLLQRRRRCQRARARALAALHAPLQWRNAGRNQAFLKPGNPQPMRLLSHTHTHAHNNTHLASPATREPRESFPTPPCAECASGLAASEPTSLLLELLEKALSDAAPIRSLPSRELEPSPNDLPLSESLATSHAKMPLPSTGKRSV